MDDEAVDQLYRAEPEGFVAARDALAKQLRQAGDREGAGAVKALRRPSRVAWALNQLRVDRPDELGELLGVADELRAAQEAAVRGDGGDLREAMARRRALVRSLAKAARARLGPSGPNAAAAVEATLDAAVLDPEVGDLLAAGRLEKEREVAGFGDLGMLADVVPIRPAKPKPEPAKAAGTQERAAPAKPDDTAARRALEEATAEADAAAARVDAARTAVEEAEAAVEAAEAALAEAREAARAARAALSAEERRARAADTARRRAEAALAALRS